MVLLGIFLIILLLALGVFLIFNTYGFFTGAPFAVTPGYIIDRLFYLVRVSDKDVIFDLGSGDGRILIQAAKKGAQGVGWEINLPIYLWSRRQVLRQGLQNRVALRYGNFWNKNLSQATMVFAFLLPEYMDKLEKKLARELKPGTRVVTYLARLPRRKPMTITDEGLAVYEF